MSREELVMDIIGELDERLINEAMPRPGKNYDKAVLSQRLEPIEPAPVNGKELGKYMLYRVLGTAAAAAFVIGAVLLLWLNRGNIITGNPGEHDGHDQPGAVTGVTGTDSTDITDSDFTSPSDISRYDQITDTAMPVPLYYEDDETYYSFMSPWKARYRSIPLELAENRGAQANDWLLSMNEREDSSTPYRLSDTANIYSFICDLEIPWESAEEWIKKSNEMYLRWEEENGRSYEEYIFADEDIGAMRKGYTAGITYLAASEYSITIGECAYSPKWLYYHTPEDYRAVGITPGMVAGMIMKYEKLGLREESRRAFMKKLALYASEDYYGDQTAGKTYAFETDGSEPFGYRAFEILSDIFCGTWELSGEHEELESTVTFGYDRDPFAHEGVPVTGIYETDEIYVIAFSNSGVGACYIIEKNDPGTMYRNDALSYNGIMVTKAPGGIVYTNRVKAEPKLKTMSRLSVLGLEYIKLVLGSGFEEFFNETIENERNGYTLRGEKYFLANIYTAGKQDWYLIDMSGSSVQLGLPYVKDRGELNQPAEYIALILQKDSGGNWTAAHGDYAQLSSHRRLMISYEAVSKASNTYNTLFGSDRDFEYRTLFGEEVKSLGLDENRIYLKITDERYNTWDKLTSVLAESFSENAVTFLTENAPTRYFELNGEVYASYSDEEYSGSERIEFKGITRESDDLFTASFSCYSANAAAPNEAVWLKDITVDFARSRSGWIIDTVDSVVSDWVIDCVNDWQEGWQELLCCKDIVFLLD